jgi:glycosyltransferase involved in cell wall biosynthesis
MLLSNCFEPDPRVYQEAKALIKTGCDVTIIAWDRDVKKPRYEEVDAIQVERIFLRSVHGRGTSQIFYLLAFWLKGFCRAIRRDFDVVHCHDFDTLPLGFLIAKIRRKTIVYDAHESYADMLVGSVHARVLMFIRYMEGLLIKRVDLLITVGEILKREFERRGAKNACVVGNWKDPKEYAFSTKILRSEKERLGIREGQIVITYIAWLSSERRIMSLVEAAKLVKDIYLIIGGDGPLKDIVRTEAVRSENIMYLGFVNPKAVPLFTALADVVFYGFDKHHPNSKYSAPNKLFEALAAGKAVITGDFGEIGKIVKEERCGISIPELSAENIKASLVSLARGKSLERYKTNAKNAGLSRFNWDFAESILCGNYADLLRQ